MKARRSEGPKNERTELRVNLDHGDKELRTQRGATTAVTTPDWRPRPERGSRCQAKGAEPPPPERLRDTPQKAMYENLMEAVVSPENATRAWKAVRRNQGAPGIDGMTTEQLRDHIRRHWATIQTKLLAGTYVPTPVRRKEIAKPDGGVRVLGIPTVSS